MQTGASRKPPRFRRNSLSAAIIAIGAMALPPLIASAADIIGREASDDSGFSGQSHTFTSADSGADELIGFRSLLPYTGNLTNNTITVSNSTGSGVAGVETDSGNASGNRLIINSGAYGYAQAAISLSGNATGNAVIINGGTFSEGVIGAGTNDGVASGNTVTILGGAISGIIAGGYIDVSDNTNLGGSGSAINNTVNIESNAADLSNADLYGALYAAAPSSGDIFTGNTLNCCGALKTDHKTGVMRVQN
ncbi:MAG: hypothetical protein LBE78_10985 [Burkholderiaceae bacterium]|nr:hypothetical protein [Burkholderiaceae bacterium]